jgi:hypothetical protein
MKTQRIRIKWAYFKLFLALLFVKDEFSKLLDNDINAMFAMKPEEIGKYTNIVMKIRNRIGNHSMSTYSIKDFIEEIRGNKLYYVFRNWTTIPLLLSFSLSPILNWHEGISGSIYLLILMIYCITLFIIYQFVLYDHEEQIKKREKPKRI